MISTGPTRIAIDKVAMPMLSTWPMRRIVPTMAEATPYTFYSTELIMAFVLGEEKSAKPNPRKI